MLYSFVLKQEENSYTCHDSPMKSVEPSRVSPLLFKSVVTRHDLRHPILQSERPIDRVECHGNLEKSYKLDHQNPGLEKSK